MVVELNETLKRLSIAVITVPIILFAMFTPDLPIFVILVVIASILMALELLSIAEIKSIRVYKSVTLASCSVIILITFLSFIYPQVNSIFSTEELIILVILISTIIVFLFETFQKDFSKTLEVVSTHILVIIYSAVSLTYLLKLQQINPFGSYLLLYIWLITWITDSGAYFSGKYFGKHKLNLKASPNKTLEGFIGGILISVLTGILLKISLPNIYSADYSFLFSYPVLIFMTFLFAVISIFGDLAESVLKRSSGIKDSKSYIPGHGGMLDVMDSLVYTAPLFYYLIKISGKL